MVPALDRLQGELPGVVSVSRLLRLRGEQLVAGVARCGVLRGFGLFAPFLHGRIVIPFRLRCKLRYREFRETPLQRVADGVEVVIVGVVHDVFNVRRVSG